MKKRGTGLIFGALMMLLQSGNALGQTDKVVIIVCDQSQPIKVVRSASSRGARHISSTTNCAQAVADLLNDEFQLMNFAIGVSDGNQNFVFVYTPAPRAALADRLLMPPGGPRPSR